MSTGKTPNGKQVTFIRNQAGREENPRPARLSRPRANARNQSKGAGCTGVKMLRMDAGYYSPVGQRRCVPCPRHLREPSRALRCLGGRIRFEDGGATSASVSSGGPSAPLRRIGASSDTVGKVVRKFRAISAFPLPSRRTNRQWAHKQ